MYWNCSILPSYSKLADTLLEDANGMFERGQIKICLDDPVSGHWMTTDNSALVSSWPRSGNDHVVKSADLLSPVENMSKISTLRAGNQSMGMMPPVCIPRMLSSVYYRLR